MHDVPGQVHWHEPTGGKRAGFGKFGRPKTPYDIFMESEGIPIFRDIGVSKVQNLPLAPWKRTGGRGSYIQLYGTEGKWGCYVIEVPGAGALNPEKHLYEEIYFVVEGRGSTEVWLDGDNKRHVFEWQKNSLFSIPVNATHRIVNASSAPALLLAGTTAPNLMNLMNNVGAIFDCPYQFRDRFSGADDFYKYKDDIEPDPVRGLAMRRTNFVPDIVNCDLPLDNRRSPGFRRVEPFMTGNTFYLWIGQHENGRYSKAHAHTSAAVLICIKGKGYTYTWPERNGVTPWQDGKASEIKRVDYEPVGMVSAAPGGARWFHQHFGASKEPLRLTAWFGPHNPGREPGPPGEQHIDYTAMDIPEGGSAIPYWMEDPVHQGRVRRAARSRGRREPHEARVLRQELQGRVAEGVARPDRLLKHNNECDNLITIGRSNVMRVVTLEEHLTVPSVVAKIDKAAIARRGFKGGRRLGAGRQNPMELLPETGEKRLKSMDDAGISTQVLSNSGPGPDLMPGQTGVDLAREVNDYHRWRRRQESEALRRLRRAADGKPRCRGRRVQARREGPQALSAPWSTAAPTASSSITRASTACWRRPKRSTCRSTSIRASRPRMCSRLTIPACRRAPTASSRPPAGAGTPRSRSRSSA